MSLIKIMLPLLSVSALMSGSAELIYQNKCLSCHGETGEKKVLGRSNIIKGMPVEKLIERTEKFSNGGKALPFAKIVKKQFVNRYSDEEIREVAEYVHNL